MVWVDLVSNGASRGILIMWDKRVVESVKHYVGNYLFSCHFKNVDNGVE